MNQCGCNHWCEPVCPERNCSWKEWKSRNSSEKGSTVAPNEHTEQSEREELTGCACRWDKYDNRVQTCERHQGWLDVVHEWAERAKAAEAALLVADKAGGEPEWYTGVDRHGVRHFYLKDEVRPSEFSEPLYTHPQPSALPDDVVKDAARYGYLVEEFGPHILESFLCVYGVRGGLETATAIAAAIDAAMLKEGE